MTGRGGIVAARVVDRHVEACMGLWYARPLLPCTCLQQSLLVRGTYLHGPPGWMHIKSNIRYTVDD